MRVEYDVAVVGSGFAGSLIATVARRLGLSVALLERGRHPRFAIGESSTPLANLLLEELTGRYNLPRIAPLTKWGTWQSTYPDIACGLKRGFSFFHHSLGKRAMSAMDRSNQLLVAASPHNRLADVHWYRAEVDELLVWEAVREGVEFLDEVKLEEAHETDAYVQLQGSRRNAPVRFRAKFVIDVTGPRGFLHKALQLPEVDLPGFPRTQALYTHFDGVQRFAESAHAGAQEPPYPIDDAAVHHVFEGGWIWVLRFNNGITSAGVAARDDVARRFRFEEGAPAWDRLLRELPSVQKQFEGARPVRAFVHSNSVAFRSGSVTGARWALLPSAAGFVDPLLSTGFPLTLLGVTRLANILETSWNSTTFRPQLLRYGQQTDEELLAASRQIAALYAAMGDPSLFSSLSLLYFAAASYAETVRRLGRPELASSFLLHDHPSFGAKAQELVRQVMTSERTLDPEELRRAVLDIIEPINIAGLGNEARRNWYPVDAEDLLAAAGKVQSNRDEIQAMLCRSGFWDRCA